MTNPLLLHGRIPDFPAIRAEHVVPAIRLLAERQDAALSVLEREIRPCWDDLGERLYDLQEPLAWAWGVVDHLLAVRNGPELRAAQAEVQDLVVAASLRLASSPAIHRAWKALPTTGLTPARQRIAACAIRDAEAAGVGLEGARRERFQAIKQEQARLSTDFSNHLLDATRAFALTLRDPAEVEGLPDGARGLAAAAARSAGEAGANPESGPWRITLDAPSFLPFMEHARRRDLRERLYRAFVARAGEANLPRVQRLLELREEEAALLGHASYAGLSLTAKMAPSVAAVDALLERLRSAARPRAEAELRELEAFAREQGAGAPLALWDLPFWAERLRETRYAVRDEEVRPFFALPTVLDGLFACAERLFGVRIEAADGAFPVWHPEVRCFRVRDTDGSELAAFLLDAYSRPADKRGGAWMNVCLERRRSAAGLRLPVAYLVCNQTPPGDGTPSLMTFREVETLFHEFGHGLQHMLTAVDEPQAAGIANVEWDAVELPSQFMENWCHDRATMLGRADRPGLARHWQTGAPLDQALFSRLTAARNFRIGSATLRQVHLACLDLELHHRRNGRDPLAVQRAVAEGHALLPPLAEDRLVCSFSHLFAGGYAAGYYSYKWAEVLAADAFAAFTEAGLEDEPAMRTIGRRFRDTVLALGGAVHPLEVFRRFRGRDPAVEALLRQGGLD